jgi:carboxymethylenebutenolidase
MRVLLPSGTEAEVARPAAPPRRGVVLIPDLMSLRPLFDELAARLAARHQWAVCAIDLFPGQRDLDQAARLSLLPELDVSSRLRDAVAAADFLDVEPVAVLGFCTGGAVALRAGGTGRFDRIVAFYGMVNGVGPDLPVLAPGVPTLELVGTEDGFIPPEDADWLEAEGATVVRYPGAGHAFAQDPARDTYRADDAADAFRRAVDWLSTSASR